MPVVALYVKPTVKHLCRRSSGGTYLLSLFGNRSKLCPSLCAYSTAIWNCKKRKFPAKCSSRCAVVPLSFLLAGLRAEKFNMDNSDVSRLLAVLNNEANTWFGESIGQTVSTRTRSKEFRKFPKTFLRLAEWNLKHPLYMSLFDTSFQPLNMRFWCGQPYKARCSLGATLNWNIDNCFWSTTAQYNRFCLFGVKLGGNGGQKTGNDLLSVEESFC